MAVTSNRAVYAKLLEMKGGINYADDELKVALMKDSFSWDAKKHKVWDASAWEADTVYAEDDLVRGDGYVHKCTSGGTSASSEPTWKTTFGETVTDNECTWECWSYRTAEDEITEENGYTGPVTLTNDNTGPLEEDEDNRQGKYTADDVSITADGGTFGPTQSAIIFDNTHSETPILGQVKFDTAYTPEDGVSVRVEDIVITNKAIQGVTG